MERRLGCLLSYWRIETVTEIPVVVAPDLKQLLSNFEFTTKINYKEECLTIIESQNVTEKLLNVESIDSDVYC